MSVRIRPRVPVNNGGMTSQKVASLTKAKLLRVVIPPCNIAGGTGVSMVEVANVYMHKNEGRLMAYIRETKQVVSYPRVIMENFLGRKLLPEEEVHHKDGNPLNNEIDNLEVMTKAEHLKIHAEENRKYFDKIMICPWCGEEFLWTADQQLKYQQNSARKRNVMESAGSPFCSKICSGKYGRSIQSKNGVVPATKLSNEQVRYIRNNYIPKDSEFGGRALARKFGVNHKTIYDIINYKSYKHIE